MGISYEKWATCDECEYQKSYPGDDEDDPPYGFYWTIDRSELLCGECFYDAEDCLEDCYCQGNCPGDSFPG